MGSTEIQWDCNGATDQEKAISLEEGSVLVIAEIPAGVTNLVIELQGFENADLEADLDIRFVDPSDDSGACVAGYDCLLACSAPGPCTATYEGMDMEFTGDMVDPNDDGIVTEKLTITGATTRAMRLEVRGFDIVNLIFIILYY